MSVTTMLLRYICEKISNVTNHLPKNTTAILSGKKWNFNRINKCVSRMHKAENKPIMKLRVCKL